MSNQSDQRDRAPISDNPFADSVLALTSDTPVGAFVTGSDVQRLDPARRAPLGSLALRKGRPIVRYSTESTLRDGLGHLAYLYGWDVDTEHHISGWGRPDLYLTSPDDTGSRFAVAVEIKLSLVKAADIRKAFQQADVYAKAIGPAVGTILTTPTVNADLAQQYDLAYTDVWFLNLNRFCEYLRGATCGMAFRHRVAHERLRALQQEVDLSVAALRLLSEFPPSPLAAPIWPKQPAAS